MPRKGERDEIWDALESIFGRVVYPTNAHAKRNKAAKDLRLLGATAASIRLAHQNYQTSFSCLCTDTALATHYPLLLAGVSQADQAAYARQQELAARFNGHAHAA